ARFCRTSASSRHSLRPARFGRKKPAARGTPPIPLKPMQEKQQRISYQPSIPIVCSNWLALSPCGFSSRATRGSWILDFDFRSKPVPEAYPISDGGRRGHSGIFFESVLAKKVRTNPRACVTEKL